jgi:FkbM family methyltransferase
MLYSTPYGDIKIRENFLEFDKEVVNEVILEHRYEHWAELEIRGTVLDCGAHIGAFSFLALSQSKTRKVIAVEPNPFTFKLLKQNAPKAILINKAITNEKYVYISDFQDRPELNKLSEVGIKVKGITLDELITEPINFLKMDIEGAEYDAFYSCNKLDMVEQISIEYHNGGTKLAQLIIYLESCGFTMKWIGGQDFGHVQFSR